MSLNRGPGLCYGPATVSGLKLAGAAGALVLVAAAAAAASPGGDRTRALRLQVGTLGARAHSAELDLYALDSQLGAAQSKLATNLQLLYEQGEPDPLAVVLGAQSLDDAVMKLDALHRVTDQNKRFVDDSTAARTQLAHLQDVLNADGARIESSVHSAQATAARLAATRAGRVAFIARLRSERRLRLERVRSIEASAHRAQVKSKALTAAAPRLEAAVMPAAQVPTPVAGARTLTVVSTGYSLPGHTATGLPVGWGVVAVDPSLIPLGTRLTIPGYGLAVAADVGSGVHGAVIDLWFPSLAQARGWGRRTVTVTLH